ncbi:uncharacterized protein [Typha latifolia]|uniref:uncharacterized protein isoform X1 n=2 Tax=Typha latifolia TaxID=4733 RepID=UPI003C2DD1B4
MKLDGKQPYQQDLAHEFASKVVRPNGNHLLIDLFKVEDEHLWEWKDDHSSSVEKQYGQPVSPFDLSYVEMGHPIDGGQTIIEQSTIQTNKAGLVVKEKDLSIDKIVTEITLPNSIDSLNDCNGNVVKDICIDEGAQAVEKILVESEEHIVSSTVNHSLSNGNDYIKKEMMDSATTIAHDLKSRSLCEPLVYVSDNNIKEQYDGGKASTTEIVGDICDKEISLKQVFPEDLAANSQQVCPMSSSCSSDCKRSVDRPTVDKDTAKECYVVETLASDTHKLNVSTQTKKNPANGFSKGTLEECSVTTGVSSDTGDSNQWNRIKACGMRIGLSGGRQKENLSLALSVASDATESNDDVCNVDGFTTSVNELLEGGSIAVTTKCYDSPMPNQNHGAEGTPTNSSSSTIPEERHSSAIDVLSDVAEYNHGSLENPGNCEIHNGASICDFVTIAEDIGGTEICKEATDSQQADHGNLDNPGSREINDGASICDFGPKPEDTGDTEVSKDATDSRQPGCGNLENTDNCEIDSEIGLHDFNPRAVDTDGTEISKATDSQQAEHGNLQNPSDGEVVNEVSVCDFNPRSEDKVNKESKNSQQPGHTQNDPVVEGSVPDSATASARSSVYRNHGDLNFCGPTISAGPIATSGHLPYSGSISLRSDSSTTSTRSFAFPILQSEWNSSPVKMAKPDRKRYRRHRGWRNGLLCCRF